jgi:hypothetical protein
LLSRPASGDARRKSHPQSLDRSLSLLDSCA